jgi:hypothetical protein
MLELVKHQDKYSRKSWADVALYQLVKRVILTEAPLSSLLMYVVLCTQASLAFFGDLSEEIYKVCIEKLLKALIGFVSLLIGLFNLFHLFSPFRTSNPIAIKHFGAVTAAAACAYPKIFLPLFFPALLKKIVKKYLYALRL